MERTGKTVDSLISARAASLEMSAIKEMSIRSAKVPGAASLAWGLPSFATPEPIRRAAEQALETDPQAGFYTLPAGLPELIEAVAHTHAERAGTEVVPSERISITAGNMEGLNTLFHVLLDPGDEVIVTDPGFVSHIQQIRFNGGVPVFWRMDEANGWALDIDALPGLVTPRTKAIVLVSPSNPTGRILSEETLRAVATLAQAAGILVILDDPYSLFTYDGATCFNLASAPEYADTVAYLFTFSKAYAMSGWRVGYMVLPPRLRDQVVKVHDLTMICTPRISQLAALAALQSDPAHLDGFRATLDRRRALICARLDRLAHVFAYARPDGAYYVFPRLLAPKTNSVDFAHALLDKAGVAVTPGAAFGPSGENHVRMAFCVEDDVINLAFDRMEAYFGT